MHSTASGNKSKAPTLLVGTHTSITEIYRTLQNAPADSFPYAEYKNSIPVIQAKPKSSDPTARLNLHNAIRMALANGTGLPRDKAEVQRVKYATRHDNPEELTVEELLGTIKPLYEAETVRLKSRNAYSRAWEDSQITLTKHLTSNCFYAVRKVLSLLPSRFDSETVPEAVNNALVTAVGKLTDTEKLFLLKAVDTFIVHAEILRPLGFPSAISHLLRAASTIVALLDHEDIDEKLLPALINTIASAHQLTLLSALTPQSSRPVMTPKSRQKSKHSRSSHKARRREKGLSMPDSSALKDEPATPKRTANTNTHASTPRRTPKRPAINDQSITPQSLSRSDTGELLTVVSPRSAVKPAQEPVDLISMDDKVPPRPESSTDATQEREKSNHRDTPNGKHRRMKSMQTDVPARVRPDTPQSEKTKTRVLPKINVDALERGARRQPSRIRAIERDEKPVEVNINLAQVWRDLPQTLKIRLPQRCGTTVLRVLMNVGDLSSHSRSELAGIFEHAFKEAQLTPQDVEKFKGAVAGLNANQNLFTSDDEKKLNYFLIQLLSLIEGQEPTSNLTNSASN